MSDQHVVLDSFLKARDSNTARGEFRWQFMLQGSTDTDRVGIRDELKTIIEVQLGPFLMPILPEVVYTTKAVPSSVPSHTDSLVLVHNNTAATSPTLLAGQYPAIIPAAGAPFTPWINNPYTQLPFGRFTIQMKEVGLQSFSGLDGARHHFEYAVSALGGLGANPHMLSALPLGDWDTFIFTDPLVSMHGITLVFRNPDKPIRFEPDCLYEATIESDAAASPGPFIRVRAPGHGLSAGDRVFLKGFTTGAPGLDAYINRADGHVAAGNPAAPLAPGTLIVLADPDVFYLDPAVSIIDLVDIPPSLPAVGDVFVAKRRLRIQMRIRCVVDRLTNYKSP